MPTVTYLESGTDATQDLTFWPQVDTSGGGTAATATDQSHTGTRSLKLVVTSGAQSVFVATADGAVADAGTRTSFWVRFASIPTADMSFISWIQTAFGSTVLGLIITSGGKLQLNDGNATIGAAGATTIAGATWTRITLSYVITTTTNWTANVYINGVLELTRTNADATLTNGIGSVAIDPNLSLPPVGAGAALTMWLDDIYSDNGTDLGDPGDVRVTAKRPFANGTANGFTTRIGAGGSGYGSGHAPQVNERPLSQTNGWSMVGAGSAVTEEYSVEGVSVGDVDLTNFALYDWVGWIFAKSLSSETASLIVGGATTNAALTSTPTLFYTAKGSTTYPAGSTDIGLITTTALTTVSLYECGVLIAYNPTVINNPPIRGAFLRSIRDTWEPPLIITVPPAKLVQPAPPPVVDNPPIAGPLSVTELLIGQTWPREWTRPQVLATVNPQTPSPPPPPSIIFGIGNRMYGWTR